MSVGNLLLLLPVTTMASPALEALLLPRGEVWGDSVFEVLGKLCVFFVLDDMFFYIYHRTLHTYPALYRAFHKPHHVFAHPFVLSAYAVTPVELSLQSIGATLGPLVLWRGSTHRHLLWLFLWLRQWQGIEDHTGYHLPIGTHLIPGVGGTTFHDAHHSVNTGNYASIFPVIDRVFGTDIKTGRDKERQPSTGPPSHS
eukprot:Hpha_TRINITY_DN7760_c0_g1::TRINITY_DN7760_c0_g1_i1::g.85414::m.85414/K07750/E1.14.13.72, SC4MOL, ERG25; methylsterol monooxygenase